MNRNHKKTPWLWPGLIQPGIHLLTGPGGSGKGLIAVRLAAAISIGDTMPDGEHAACGEVYIFAPDDGVDLDRRLARLEPFLHALSIKVCRFADAEYPATDLSFLLAKYPACKFIVIDPAESIFDADDTDTRRRLGQLSRTAKRHGTAVMFSTADTHNPAVAVIRRLAASTWRITERDTINRALRCTAGPGKGRGFLFDVAGGKANFNRCLYPKGGAA